MSIIRIWNNHTYNNFTVKLKLTAFAKSLISIVKVMLPINFILSFHDYYLTRLMVVSNGFKLIKIFYNL